MEILKYKKKKILMKQMFLDLIMVNKIKILDKETIEDILYMVGLKIP